MDKTACSDLNKYFNVEPATMNGSTKKKERQPIKSKEILCKWQRQIQATFYRRFLVYSMGCVWM